MLNLEGCFNFGYNDSSFESLRGMPLVDLKLNVYAPSCVTNIGFENLKGWPPTVLHIHSGESDTFCITDFGLEETLRGMVLTDLELIGLHRVRGTGLAVLRGMPLKKLDLSMSDLSGIAEEGGRIPDLAGLPLTDVSLNETNINDVGLECLRGLPLIRAEFCSCRQLSGSGFAALREAPLRRLILEGPDSLFRVAADVLGQTDGLVRLEGWVMNRVVGSSEEGFLWEEVDE